MARQAPWLRRAWGARKARTHGEVLAFVGDGSYLMLNSELYSATLAGDKLIVILCDNGGYAVIHRLQVGQGGAAYNNMLDDVRPGRAAVDWVAPARALGCLAEEVTSVDELEAAYDWTPGGAFWEVGVPEVAHRDEVLAARGRLDDGKRRQRVGW